MAAETLVEIYRFGENAGAYTSFTLLVYEGDTVMAKGLAEKVTRDDAKELLTYLHTKGVKTIQFIRKGRLKSHNVRPLIAV